MAQIYRRPLMEARQMEQEGLWKKKNNLLKVLCFFNSLFALNVCKNYPGQYTNAQNMTKQPQR